MGRSDASEIGELAPSDGRRRSTFGERFDQPPAVVSIVFPATAAEPGYVADVRDRGFEVVAGRNAAEIGRLMQTRQVFAALIDSDPEVSAHRDAVERIREMAPDLRLVGVVPALCVRGPALAGLVEDGTFYDFHTKPVDVDRLAYMLGHLRGLAAVGRQAHLAAARSPAESYMVGASEAMLDVYAKIRKFAPVDAPVLITGETGTGKEVAARAIHERSSFKDGPFVAINCAALPATLIAAELFGHEKGTFTGAHQRKVGRLETANKGTVFLDEIGDMPLEVQAHLLRFLQDKTIDRLGGVTPIRIDCRVIVATNVDLEGGVRQGRFREDLLYRLKVLTLHMPALRDRGDDIELLAAYFLDEFARDHKHRGLRFSRAARVAMRNYPWPGNVRELISMVRRGAVLANGGLITPADLGLDGVAAESPPSVPTLAHAKAEVERKLILDSLRRNANVVQHAARDLGISRVAFYRLLRKFDISHELRH